MFERRRGKRIGCRMGGNTYAEHRDVGRGVSFAVIAKGETGPLEDTYATVVGQCARE